MVNEEINKNSLESTTKNLRQPIVTVCGHVDHGKTSILDRLRGTSLQEREAGGITQKISFSLIPKEKILERCKELLSQFNIPLEIPGILFIDTPGHAAFTNLRKRGGSLADIAVLVIDINEGIKPQTLEVLSILKSNKTPFVIALNKIDNISGWKTSETKRVIDSIKNQAINVRRDFEEKLLTLIGSLQSHKIDSELYFKITDFTKKVAIVPCSARREEGIEELLCVLCALTQKFLKKRLEQKEVGKGVILEVKKDSTSNYLEIILSDGELKEGDEIAIASFDNPIRTRVRSIQIALPLNKGFSFSEKITAAAGARIQITSEEKIYSGMPFMVINNNFDEIKKEFFKEISNAIKLDEKGIFVKADSLGSLEALINLLHENNIKIRKAGIGPITKKDLSFASTLDEGERIILGFNVGLEESLSSSQKIKIILGEVVYKIIEDLQKYLEEYRIQKEREKLESLPSLCKIRVLNFVFRNSNPAIFGVRVEEGVLKKEEELINSKGEKIGRVKTIQKEKNNLDKALKGEEVAICVPGLNFERQLNFEEFLYSNLTEHEFREFKKNKELLSSEEKQILQEIASIKRKTNINWGL
ncbi:MAG: translation initiation factor IF-2 [Candidatus Pacearchaeota archaeon]